MGVRSRLQRPAVMRLAQFAVTGHWNHPAYPLLAAEIGKGPHDSVLDLGSGRSLLLEHLDPQRYIGLDLHAPDLEYARRRYGRPHYEFLEADILETPLEPWRGVDVVTSCAVFHHLRDEEVTGLVDRVATEVQPQRLIFVDTVTIGTLGGLVARLDYGEPTRSREELLDLFRPRFEVSEVWSYENRFRTICAFCFELKPTSVQDYRP